jgi:hypothetical protein
MSNQIFRVLTLASILCPACAPEDEGDVGSRMGGMGTGSGTGGGTVFNTNVLDEDALSEVLQPLGTSHQGMALSAVTAQARDDARALQRRGRRAGRVRQQGQGVR